MERRQDVNGSPKVNCNGEASQDSSSSNEGGCDSEDRRNDKKVKKRRVRYNREFLLRCSQSVNSRRKPDYFPLPYLGCTLAEIRPDTSLKIKACAPIHAMPPCLPPPSSAYIPPRRRDNRDRDGRRGDFRRGRDNGDDEYLHGKGHGDSAPHSYNGQGQGSWGPSYRTSYRHDGGRRDGYGHGHSDREPEWFSEGPTSRHETMELRGFQDDNRQDPGRAKRSQTPDEVEMRAVPENKDAPPSKPEAEFSLDKFLKFDMLPKELVEEPQPRGVSRFSQIFQKNATDSVKEDVQKQQGSIFDKFCTRSSASTEEPTATSSQTAEEKKEIVNELGDALRSMLRINPSKEGKVKTVTTSAGERKEPAPGPSMALPVFNRVTKVPTPSAPPPPQQKDAPGGVHALQALLQKIIVPEKSETPTQETISRPGSSLNRPSSGADHPYWNPNHMPPFKVQQGNFSGPMPGLPPEQYQFLPPQNFMRGPPPPNMMQAAHLGNGVFRPIAKVPVAPQYHQHAAMAPPQCYNVLENFARPNMPPSNIPMHREQFPPHQQMHPAQFQQMHHPLQMMRHMMPQYQVHPPPHCQPQPMMNVPHPPPSHDMSRSS